VKFLSEKAVFDCVHYGVLGALNKTPDRPQMQFKPQAAPAATQPAKPQAVPAPAKAPQQNFFRTMTAEEYKHFSTAIAQAPQPKKEAAAATAAKLPSASFAVRESVMLPKQEPVQPAAPAIPVSPVVTAAQPEEQMGQITLPMPQEVPWRLVGELYNSYIIVEQGEEAFLIDKHAAHERILFEKLKKNQEAISSQSLLTPVTVRLNPSAAAELLANRELLTQLGFELEEFGESTLLLRQIPMDLSPEGAAEAVESIAADLLNGRREEITKVRDEVLHTVACKAAVKAGWLSDEKELLALVKQVMADEDLKYCPHGRPICITLSKKQLEKQFKRA